MQIRYKASATGLLGAMANLSRTREGDTGQMTDAHITKLGGLSVTMSFYLPRWSGWMVLLALLTSGCATLRDSAPEGLAALIDRAPVPEQVAGLNYQEIAELGVADSCRLLADTHASGRRMPRRELNRQLPVCQAEVEQALAQRAEAARLDTLVEQAWQDLQARRERLRLEAERRRLEEELHARQMQHEQERLEQEAQEANSRQQWQAQLAAASVHAVLTEYELEDKPVAYSPGQVSERSLSNFLACVELAYPNRGYQITRDGRRLVVVARRAALPRGEMPIEARFTEQDEFWLLTYLQVAEITAATAQDRFILAQNLIAQSCYSQDGLL